RAADFGAAEIAFAATGLSGISTNRLKQISLSSSSFKKRQSLTLSTDSGFGLVRGGAISSKQSRRGFVMSLNSRQLRSLSSKDCASAVAISPGKRTQASALIAKTRIKSLPSVRCLPHPMTELSILADSPHRTGL